MWRYNQRTGQLSKDTAAIAVGYSGHAEGRNNPAMQDHKMLGPLPRGFYTFHAPVDTAAHGPYVLRLVQDPSDEMFGRDGFLMHGDNVKHDASEGCIIMPPQIRRQVWESGDHRLEVYTDEIVGTAA